MRPPRQRRRRHPSRERRERDRPKGYSDPVGGPIFRGILTLLGVPREERRQAYNVLSVGLVVLFTLVIAANSLIFHGPSSGLGTLIGSLMIGWIVITHGRFFR